MCCKKLPVEIIQQPLLNDFFHTCTLYSRSYCLSSKNS
jgi:hypothetical protein